MIKLRDLLKETELFRDNTGTTNLKDSADRIASTLSKNNIPHLIVGGYALQSYGYNRTTTDIDIIVPNRKEAIDYLSIRGYQEVTGNKMKLIDRKNRVEIDVLESGEKLNSKSQIPLPLPKKISGKPEIINITDLINLKLDSYSTSSNRLIDGNDVGKLIEIHKLPLDLYKELNSTVQDSYKDLWMRYHK